MDADRHYEDAQHHEKARAHAAGFRNPDPNHRFGGLSPATGGGASWGDKISVGGRISEATSRVYQQTSVAAVMAENLETLADRLLGQAPQDRAGSLSNAAATVPSANLDQLEIAQGVLSQTLGRLAEAASRLQLL